MQQVLLCISYEARYLVISNKGPAEAIRVEVVNSTQNLHHIYIPCGL